jgi:hypothetical protein
MATAGSTRPARAPRAAKAPDAALVSDAAIERARDAAAEEAGADQVGGHESFAAEGDRIVTHHFTSLAKGYRGWRWAVTLTRASRSRTVTVSEVVLLPGDEAILPPVWLPWADRLAPGDLGAADTLPFRADDLRLEPGYQATQDQDADQLAVWELGLGRVRVLSPEGRADAAARWYAGDGGPTTESALHAPCLTCGFFVNLPGSLRQMFGVCANEWSPADGRVVSYNHGCGAHSETDVEHPDAEALPDLILDEIGTDSITLVPRDLARDVVGRADEAVSAEPAVDAGVEPAADAGAEGEAPDR